MIKGNAGMSIESSRHHQTYVIKQHKAFIAVKTIANAADLRIVWTREKKSAAEFSSRSNAEEFIVNNQLLSAKVLESS